jgi:hypothetical protein
MLAPQLLCSDYVKPASINSQHMPTAVEEWLDAPNRHLSPLKHSFFNAATLS